MPFNRTTSGQDSHAAVIQVFLQTNRFRKDLSQYMPSLAVPLPLPTNNTLEVNRWADYLCERMFKEGYQYKKAGIMLSEISRVRINRAICWRLRQQVTADLCRRWTA